MSSDRAVRETNTDAATSKLSCIKAGYYEDEFLPMFVNSHVRRNPIINRGYYVRVMMIRRIIDEFIRAHAEGSQIVILGAGADTNGLHALKHTQSPLRVFEIDFPEVALRKAHVIDQHMGDQLAFLTINDKTPELIQSVRGDVFYIGSRISLIGHDLRRAPSQLESKLERAGFDRSVPTLFLSECVLIYMHQSEADSVLEWIAKNSLNEHISRMIAIYEQVNDSDPFGRMMVENLAARGCALSSIQPSIVAQQVRLMNAGLKHARVELMSSLDRLVRQTRPEIIDEFEEYDMLQSHYAISLAWMPDNPQLLHAVSKIFERNDNESD